MIKIENVDVYGFDAAIRGMRNPLNSWDKSDSYGKCDMEGVECYGDRGHFVIGENDSKLMQKLIKAGSDHSKFMRMINVTCDITAPLYWWAEYDTYKVGTVRNSCSKMHTIHKKPFEIDDFSHEKLLEETVECMEEVIANLNYFRDRYNETGDKKSWWQIIQLLPSSYNQRSTVQMNYAVLRNMYHARKNHKLDEWHMFCDWVQTLPESELITEGGVNNEQTAQR